LWEDITIVFELTGDIDREKVEKACALSMDKYCSVAKTLRTSGSDIKWKVIVNNQ
jgi:putative redox protein